MCCPVPWLPAYRPRAAGRAAVGVERVVDAVLSSGKLVAADLAEFNPSFRPRRPDRQGGGRLAARLARGKI